MSLHVQSLLDRFEGLRGAEVTSWKGVEMAFTEGREDGELWDDESVPYLQMHLVDISRKDGAMFRIATEQADLLFGLSVQEPIPKANRESDWKGVFRERTLDELPVGRISRVEVAVENELIDRVTLFIGSCQIQISAGEIYEENDRTLRVVPQDESVLVQVDGAHPSAEQGDRTRTPDPDIRMRCLPLASADDSFCNDGKHTGPITPTGTNCDGPRNLPR